jgi:hypothetical protein
VALHAEPEPDRGRARLRQPPPEGPHDVHVEVAHPGSPFDGPVGEALLELRPADGVTLEPVAVGGALVEHGTHEAERQSGVGAGEGRDVLVAARGRLGSNRVDGHEVGSAASCLEHELPLMHVGVERVRPPQDHELRLGDVLGVEPHRRAERDVASGVRGTGAQVQLQP